MGWAFGYLLTSVRHQSGLPRTPKVTTTSSCRIGASSRSSAGSQPAEYRSHIGRSGGGPWGETVQVNRSP